MEAICGLCEWVCGVTNTIIFWIFTVSLLTFLLPQALQSFVYTKEQDLKKKYSAEWALVTGGSSGIGYSICKKLAAQGLNVVVVALNDEVFRKSFAELESAYPAQKFRQIGVDLSKPEQAIEEIKEQTSDITIQILFNNAGYIASGLFANMSIERQLGNYHVNQTISLLTTHHFVNILIDKKLRGCVCFTSSPAGQMPGPLAAIYGATKAFLTNFGSSLACELKSEGIDVLVMHPSPVNTRFYDTAEKGSSLSFFKKTATSADTIASSMISSVGRFGCIIREQGYFAVSLQILLSIVRFHFLTIVFSNFIGLSGEFKEFKSKRNK